MGRTGLLNSAFRVQLVRTLLHHEGALQRLRPYVLPEAFAEGVEQQVVEFILAHFDEHNRPPSLFVFEDEFEKADVDDAAQAEIIELIDGKPDDPSYVESTTIEFVQVRNAMDAATSLLEELESGATYRDTMGVFQKSIVEFEEAKGSRIILPRDLHVDFDETYRFRSKTGFAEIDDALGGGMPNGTLGMVIAPPNHGKSTMLIHLGAQAIRQKLGVLHVSVEMSAQEIAKRYRNAGCMPKARRKNAPARLIIEAFENSQYTSDSLRQSIEAANAEGTPIDVVIVDYAGEMAARKSYDNRRDELKSIVSDLRGIAVGMDLLCWSAAQANRENADKRQLVRVNHTADSFGIVHVADAMLTISRMSKDPAETRDLEILLDKNRLGPVGVSASVFADYKRAAFREEGADDTHGVGAHLNI